LLPRSGLERSDFVLWHEAADPRGSLDGRFRGKKAEVARISHFGSV
jgi:hypothetical protein